MCSCSDRLSQTVARGISKTGVAVEMMDLVSADPQELVECVGRSSALVVMAPQPDTPAASSLGTVLAASKDKQRVLVVESYGGNDEPVDLIVSKVPSLTAFRSPAPPETTRSQDMALPPAADNDEDDDGDDDDASYDDNDMTTMMMMMMMMVVVVVVTMMMLRSLGAESPLLCLPAPSVCVQGAQVRRRGGARSRDPDGQDLPDGRGGRDRHGTGAAEEGEHGCPQEHGQPARKGPRAHLG